MYPVLIFLHSLLRWAVLVTLLYSVYRSSRGLRYRKGYTMFDNKVRVITVSTAHVQFIFGLLLYFTSPVVGYFLHHFKEAVHIRDQRFFGMEHITMMLLAIVIITIGSSVTKRKKTDREKFKSMAIWFSIGLVIIFFAIPWPFSPFTSRPYWRPL